jgi:hypothetical protein
LDAVLGIIAALGLRELLPRIVALLAARRSASIPPPPTTTVNVQTAQPRRSEQMPPELSDTQRDLRAATMLGGMRCDRHQSLEDTVAELASAARENRATSALRFDQVDARLDGHHAVLSEMRDSLIRLEARDDREPRRYPVGVVRGGAAGPR